MKIYLASSWRNKKYESARDIIRLTLPQHEFYDFRDEETAFHWSQVWDALGKGGDWTESTIIEYFEMLEHPLAQAGFDKDMTHLNKSDALILILPCGKSAHLEAGYASGALKPTAALLDKETFEPELMYNMLNFMTDELDALCEWVDEL